jgi:glycosyltransferase involved in cell wall biosynthesis
MKKLLSACMITKNEAEYLQYSIESFIDYVDELIVIDDNSTDGTQDIVLSFPRTRLITGGTYNGDKVRQRSEYLKHATGKWLLIPDGDEIYCGEDMERLINYISRDDHRVISILVRLINFWKDYRHVIHGHMWDNLMQRIVKNMPGMGYYDLHHSLSLKPGTVLSTHAHKEKIQIRDSYFRIYHYSYCKKASGIRKKIEYYMRRDNPNCITDNKPDERLVKLYTEKHPYFSEKYNNERYGIHGLYCCGNTPTQKDHVLRFIGEQPEIIKKHPNYSLLHGYVAGMNNYMESHWQFHNHLDHARHRARIIMTSQYCIGNTLDVGCANGFSTYLMQRRHDDKKFTGVEPTDWGFNEARRKYPQIKFYKYYAENMAFDDNSYDTVLLSEIIEHCENPRAVADEAFRIAKTRVIITTPTKPHPDPDHKRHFTIQQMLEFVRPYGGKVGIHGLDKTGNKVTDREKIYG